MVASVCIQAAGGVQLKSKSFKELAQTERVTFGNWARMDGKLVTVDIADDETIIGTNSNQDIYQRLGIHGKWSQIPGKAVQVSTGGKGKYVAVNIHGEVSKWNEDK